MNDSPDAAAQESGGDSAEVLAFVDLATDRAAAIVADDPTRIAPFMADEWVIVSESGIDPKEKFPSLVESGDLTHSAMDLRPPRARVHGETALVAGRVTNTARFRGERYDADEWTTDVFVKRDGRWLCLLSHITPAAPD